MPTVTSLPAVTSDARSSGKNSGASTWMRIAPGITGIATPTPSRGMSRSLTRITVLGGSSGMVIVRRPTRGRTAVSSLLPASRAAA